MARDARLSILTAHEVEDLYGLPCFTEDDRSLYFDLGTAERELVDGVFTISVAVHLVLQFGYFKAKRQFFVYDLQAVEDDLQYILRHHFPKRHLSEINLLSKPTRLEQQRAILRLFDYRPCDAAAKAELEQKAQRVAMLSAQPVFILREVLQHLVHRRIVAPGYTYLQDMVGRTVSGERLRITRLLGRSLTPVTVERQLEALLEADEGMYPESACSKSMNPRTSVMASCVRRSSAASSSSRRFLSSARTFLTIGRPIQREPWK